MSIIVCPLHDVTALVRLRRPECVVSLMSPTAAPVVLPPSNARHLELRFNDIGEPRPGLTEPDKSHVAAMLAHAKSVDLEDTVLVHCWAGVSRSPAGAFILACARSERGMEPIIARRLRQAAPYATPNPRMIALADALLDRGGAMIEAIAAIGRGSETAWGSAFELEY